MRRKLTFALVLLNLLLGIAILARSADSQVIPRGILNCCQQDGGDPYCCFGCCWFVYDCKTQRDCDDPTRSIGG